ncbi:MAG: hypothetical protein DWI03_10590 [Planctomycetota bacterium]|nr:MAG: hypothetical protein DWI03_10590 [Planctomycetota bacterium]
MTGGATTGAATGAATGAMTGAMTGATAYAGFRKQLPQPANKSLRQHWPRTGVAPADATPMATIKTPSTRRVVIQLSSLSCHPPAIPARSVGDIPNVGRATHGLRRKKPVAFHEFPNLTPHDRQEAHRRHDRTPVWLLEASSARRRPRRPGPGKTPGRPGKTFPHRQRP